MGYKSCLTTSCALNARNIGRHESCGCPRGRGEYRSLVFKLGAPTAIYPDSMTTSHGRPSTTKSSCGRGDTIHGRCTTLRTTSYKLGQDCIAKTAWSSSVSFSRIVAKGSTGVHKELSTSLNHSWTSRGNYPCLQNANVGEENTQFSKLGSFNDEIRLGLSHLLLDKRHPKIATSLHSQALALLKPDSTR